MTSKKPSIEYRVEQYIKWEGGWEALWSIIRRDPIILDHIFKYLQDNIEEWEAREYPDGYDEDEYDD